MSRQEFLGLCRAGLVASQSPQVNVGVVRERWHGDRAYFLGSFTGDEHYLVTCWRLERWNDDSERMVYVTMEIQRLCRLLRSGNWI